MKNSVVRRLAMLSLLLVSLPAFGQMHHERLSSDDTEISSGEYHDVFYFNATAGQRVNITMESSEFDPYLIVYTPSSYTFDDEVDKSGQTDDIAFSFIAEETGGYRILATSTSPNQIGDYNLNITIDDVHFSTSEDCSGELAAGDSRLENEELYDTYYFRGIAGRRINAQVKSSEFDTYIILVSPMDEIYENDDFGHNKDQSYLSVMPEESGEWRMIVTSYEGGEEGAYQASVRLEGSVSAGGYATSKISDVMMATEIHDDELDPTDKKLNSGEIYDLYYVNVEAGESITASLVSESFDTYLILRTPAGENAMQNDDFNNSKNQSYIHYTTAVSGTWAILVTSYGAGETGAYHLEIRGGNPKVSANE